MAKRKRVGKRTSKPRKRSKMARSRRRAKGKYKGPRVTSVYRSSFGIPRRRCLTWKHTFSYIDIRNGVQGAGLLTRPLIIDPSNIYNPLGLDRPAAAGSMIPTVQDFIQASGEAGALYRPCMDHDDLAVQFGSYMVDSVIVVAKFVVPQFSTIGGGVQAIGAKLFAGTVTQPFNAATVSDFTRQYGPFTMYDQDRTKQAVIRKKFVPYAGAPVGKEERLSRLKQFFQANSDVPHMSSDNVNLVFYLPPPTASYEGGAHLQLTLELYYNIFLEDAKHVEDVKVDLNPM